MTFISSSRDLLNLLLIRVPAYLLWLKISNVLSKAQVKCHFYHKGLGRAKGICTIPGKQYSSGVLCLSSLGGKKDCNGAQLIGLLWGGNEAIHEKHSKLPEGQCSFFLFYSCYFTVKQVIDVATVIIFAVYMQAPALFNYRQTQSEAWALHPPNPGPRRLCGVWDSQLFPGTARLDLMVRQGTILCFNCVKKWQQ